MVIEQALLAAESALQKLDTTAAAQVNALQKSEYKTLRLSLWNQRLNPSKPVSVSTITTSDMWRVAIPQTQGAWALEQAGAWLQAADPQANQRIEEWYASGDWFQGDFESSDIYPGVFNSFSLKVPSTRVIRKRHSII